jgi:hypothetical protein
MSQRLFAVAVRRLLTPTLLAGAFALAATTVASVASADETHPHSVMDSAHASVGRGNAVRISGARTLPNHSHASPSRSVGRVRSQRR